MRPLQTNEHKCGFGHFYYEDISKALLTDFDTIIKLSQRLDNEGIRVFE